MTCQSQREDSNQEGLALNQGFSNEKLKYKIRLSAYRDLRFSIFIKIQGVNNASDSWTYFEQGPNLLGYLSRLKVKKK